MKDFLKDLLIIILVVLGVGISTAIVDYLRINNNSKPIFSLTSYDKKNDLVVYQGLFHKIDIKYSMSSNEKISDAKDIKYYVFNKYNIKLDKKVLNTKNYYYIKSKEEDTCTSSKLVYYNDKYKLYSYCLDSDSLLVENYRSGEKDVLLSEFLKKHDFKDVFGSFYYSGFAVDSKSLEYTNKDDNKLKLIECKINNNTDYYLGPVDMEYQMDFCTNKNDIVKEEVVKK